MKYEDLNLKKPQESEGYSASSHQAVESIESIVDEAVKSGQNKIVINTNLKLGLPMENINKIAGPFIEAWAQETFTTIKDDSANKWNLINAESLERLHRADILLQFKKEAEKDPVITAQVDVKATAEDFENSGKSPNITSFARIRSAYVEDPDYMFVILSLKHKVYSQRNEETRLMDGIMEVVKYNAYDIKYLSDTDINYNSALGTGQIQIKDIHYVEVQKRSSWEFCQLLDEKYLASPKRSFESWLELANRYKWIK